MPGMLTKKAGEVETFAFEFKQRAELVAGDTLTGTPTVSATPSGLTLGSPFLSGSQVRVTISGGTSGTQYLVTCTVVTAGGSTLQSVGPLNVVPV
jgi:hypothetical protein